MSTQNNSIGEIVRKLENEYVRGNTQISDYVNFSMYETINKIEAYLNSRHVSGEKDSKERKKPFFNIVTSARNIWYRATDIDRKNIKIRPTKNGDVVPAFLATVLLHDWMRKSGFGVFLNEWGRTLAAYGSAVTKFVSKDDGLHAMVVPWNRIICDPIDFDNNVKIEVLELTQAQLRKNKLYSKEAVDALCDALTTRETLDKRRKDNRSDYVKLYEVHGEISLAQYKRAKGIEPDEEDDDEYVQAMVVMSFTGAEKKGEYEDFILYCGLEEKDPYVITHLIKEDGRTLGIGAVENLFNAQWMVNDTVKATKDHLDLASKLIFQTADTSFVGQNALSAIETGDILIHAPNQPLTGVNNRADVAPLQSFRQEWQQLGNQINGISDAMQGEVKAGAAWRQTEALLAESHSLFELMTENKGLSLEEDMLKKHVLPFLKRNIDTADEVSAIMDGFSIKEFDSKFIKNFSIRKSNQIIKDVFMSGGVVDAQQQAMIQESVAGQTKDMLSNMGNNRFIKPSDVPDKTWKEITKDLEWEVEVDITGEQSDVKEALTTLNTALQLVMNPAYAQNKQAQFIVGKILQKAGTLSELELASLPEATMPVGQMARSATGIPELSAQPK